MVWIDGLRVLDRLWPAVSLYKPESLQLRQEMVRHEAVASSKVICVNTIFLNPDGRLARGIPPAPATASTPSQWSALTSAWITVFSCGRPIESEYF